ncbi:uncharacterized protein LOC132620221 [Lycium barbarum]|uniref:uncharacterized protein LOC132620221 n=1 Tax=Lycium barbarum TaxID=112863 RepID=UPI00293EBEDC|nr:uncharacterized protein LOC132620221 [Lycium barbarum]
MHKVQFATVQEPFLDESHLEKYIKKKSGFTNSMVNRNSKIWCFWDESLDCTVNSNNNQQLTLKIKYLTTSITFWYTIVYAKTTTKKRKKLWCKLRQNMHKIDGPWVVLGDFNAILSPNEKKGGRPHKISQSMDFITCMDDCGLFDARYSGNTFTWSNGRKKGNRICKRLDRILYNEEWSNNTGDTLTLQPSFLQVVQNSWEEAVQGNCMWILQEKLKRLASTLSQWSKNTIRDVFQHVKNYEEIILDREQKMDNDDSEENRQELNRMNAEYIKWAGLQDNLLQQKANIQWNEEGDSCTKYFFSCIKHKRRKATLHRIKNSTGNWIEGNEAIGNAAIQHFEELFTDSNYIPNFGVLNHIEKLNSEEENTKLSAFPEK